MTATEFVAFVRSIDISKGLTSRDLVKDGHIYALVLLGVQLRKAGHGEGTVLPALGALHAALLMVETLLSGGSTRCEPGSYNAAETGYLFAQGLAPLFLEATKNGDPGPQEFIYDRMRLAGYEADDVIDFPAYVTADACYETAMKLASCANGLIECIESMDADEVKVSSASGIRIKMYVGEQGLIDQPLFLAIRRFRVALDAHRRWDAQAMTLQEFREEHVPVLLSLLRLGRFTAAQAA